MSKGLVLLALALLCPAAYAADSPWKFEHGGESYLTGQGAALEISALNPANATFALPAAEANADLRPSFTLSYGERWKAILAPRLQLSESWIEQGALTTTAFNDTLSLTQGYVAWNLTDNLLLTAGVQNYQWGPSEVISPSNPLIHFVDGQRSILWSEKGRGLVRANYSIGQSLSIVLLGSVFDNALTVANSGGTFTRMGLLKAEYQLSPATYFGVTGGGGPDIPSFVGEYGSLSLSDAISVYADARHTQGSLAYYPALLPDGTPGLQQLNDQNTYVGTLMDAGVRYEGRVDVRAEFILNTDGYNQAQFQEVLALGAQSGLLANAGGAKIPGLEFPGRYYLYGSIRVPDIGYQKKMTAGLRYLFSLLDQSGIGFLSVDQAVSDFVNVVSEVSWSLGTANSEFTLLQSYSGLLGVRIAL